MAPTPNAVFFYGLYMDPEVRAPMSGERRPGTVATLDEYECVLGARSTLAPKPGSRVYGVVAELSDAECGRLYPVPTYSAYLPTKVTCTDPVTARPLPAIAYIAPADGIGEYDPEYADKLIALCRRLGFPSDYLGRLERARSGRD
jgi:hypothetical protein